MDLLTPFDTHLEPQNLKPSPALDIEPNINPSTEHPINARMSAQNVVFELTRATFCIGFCDAKRNVDGNRVQGLRFSV